MGDRVDELMTKVMPDITKTIAAGLSSGTKLDDFVTVTSTDDATPFRVVERSWKSHPQQPALQAATATAELLEYGGKLIGAVELAVRMSFLADGTYDRAHDTSVAEFSSSAREAERRAVLQLIAADLTPERGALEQTVVDAAKPFKNRCRLITDDKELGEKLKADGTVDDAVASEGTLPNGIAALLVPIDNGPIVQRIVDDFTLSWERPTRAGATPHQVDLVLAERFFFTKGTSAVAIAAKSGG